MYAVCCLDRVGVYTRETSWENSGEQCREAFLFICFMTSCVKVSLCVQTYDSEKLHTYTPAYIHTYIHTYIHQTTTNSKMATRSKRTIRSQITIIWGKQATDTNSWLLYLNLKRPEILKWTRIRFLSSIIGGPWTNKNYIVYCLLIYNI